ncbi:MAG: 2-oxo acid dehydrogenase subunit E2 [Nitrospinales bacterium]
MLQEIKLPPLGDGISDGDVVNVLVQEGSVVTKDAILLELETEKAVVEVPTPHAGRIDKVHIRNGEKIRVGQLMFSLETDTVPQEATLPAETMQDPKKDEEVRLEETPQTVPETKTEPSEEVPERNETAGPPPGSLEIVPAGPAARRLARELGVDLAHAAGTGRGGRITLDDVKAYARRLLSTPSGSKISETEELPDFSRWGTVERKAMPSLRVKIADRMLSAWNTVPLVTQFDEADITDLEGIRKKESEYVKKQGGRLTVTVFVLKAVASALKAFPQFNASVDPRRNEMVYKRYYNIGVAVDTPSGLIVPVIKNVDKKSFLALAVELTDLAKRTRERKVSLDELRGGNISISNLGGIRGNISISNLGGISGTGFTPLVIPPDVAVVGLSRSALKPMWRNETFEPRLIMPFCVGYDHRVIDGADAARFSRYIARALENYEELMLGG